MKRPKLQIITTDRLLAADISMKLVQMGYAINGFSETVDEVSPVDDIKAFILDARTSRPPLEDHLPFVLLAGLEMENDDHQIDRETQAELSPPFSKIRLGKALDKILLPVNASPKTSSEPDLISAPMKDRIFVRYKEKMVKLKIVDILYVEADRNYSRIHAKDKEYVLATTLKAMEAKLPDSIFFRVHRSYIINLLHVDEVSDTQLLIGQKTIPISKSLRASFVKRLRTV